MAALAAIDRASETMIWIERLDEWWKAAIANESLDPNDPSELYDYYHCLLVMTYFLGAYAFPEEALYLAREHRLAVYDMGNVSLLHRLGEIFNNAEVYEEALPLLEHAVANIDEDTDEDDVESTYEQLDICKQALNLAVAPRKVSKPWWKIW